MKRKNKIKTLIIFQVLMILGSISSLNATEKDADLKLKLQSYISSNDRIKLKTPTHIAFGPDSQEIVCDLKNHRFLYRKKSNDDFKVSPVPLKGQHSLVYNPADKLYYINDTDNHRIIAVSSLADNKVDFQTKKIAGVTLKRPHDIVLDPKTGWLYAINPKLRTCLSL